MEGRDSGIRGGPVTGVARRLLALSAAAALLATATASAGEPGTVRKAGENEQVRKLIGTGAEVFARGLDKQAEHEADRLAMGLAARAGYDPFGLPGVLQELGHFAADDRSVSLLFKTHPHPDERLANLEETGERLEAVRGRVNQGRFHRIRP